MPLCALSYRRVTTVINMASETARSATSGDQSVGHKIKLARSLKHVTQSDLATRLGVSFQQIQKYEKGVNRVPAQRLREISKTLGVPLTWFFDDETESASNTLGNDTLGALTTPEGILLLKTFARIRSPAVRRRVVALVISVADSADLD